MHQKIHVSVSLDPETDRALEVRAQAEGVKKGELIVEYIAQGLCMPDAVPHGERGEPSPVPSAATGARVHRVIYIDDGLLTTLSSRAASEGVSKSRLADRFCLEGLARPPSSGQIAARARERFVAWSKTRIAHFKEVADEATKTLAEEIAKFQKSCPHVRVVETSECRVDQLWYPGEGQGERPGAKMCEDCGFGESPHPMLDRFRDRVLEGPAARTVDAKEFKRLYLEHPYRLDL